LSEPGFIACLPKPWRRQGLEDLTGLDFPLSKGARGMIVKLTRMTFKYHFNSPTSATIICYRIFPIAIMVNDIVKFYFAEKMPIPAQNRKF